MVAEECRGAYTGVRAADAHRVILTRANVIFGQYERLAPPPEVFGGSIPSYGPIIMIKSLRVDRYSRFTEL